MTGHLVAWSLDIPWPGIWIPPGSSFDPETISQRTVSDRRRHSLLQICRDVHYGSLINTIQKLHIASPLPQKLLSITEPAVL